MICKFFVATMLCAGVAQQAASPVSAKRSAFEVVSIRQNVAGGTVTKFGATPDGFRMVNMTLGRVISTAYVPQTGAALFWEPVGFPDWVRQNRYDIEAKVAEADQAEWQRQGPQGEMLRAMLQTLLAERCKLVVHREMKDAKVYYLEVGKDGPKFGARFKESTDSEAASAEAASPFPGGGLVRPDGANMRFSGAPMTLLASFLTNRNLGGPEVQDRTGLKGRYDMVVEWGAPSAGLGVAAADEGPSLSAAVSSLGLKLEAAKGQTEILVVERVERPSEN